MGRMHIVITDFNGYDQTRQCLTALHESHFQEFEILVVDHGTTNKTQKGLSRDFPHALRVAGPACLWWAGATNLGIRTALDRGANSIMLINNDCYVTPSTIGALVLLSQSNPNSIIAPIQRDWKSGEITARRATTCFLFGFPTVQLPKCMIPAVNPPRLLRANLIFGGRGALIPRSVFSEIGFLDEDNLPHYGADHDFYLRARACGIPMYVAPRCIVDIDTTRTTLAESPGRMHVSQFIESFKSVRSHRNLRDITVLFRKHYPIPKMHYVGIALHTLRYVLVYIISRTLFLLGRKGRGTN